MHSHRFAESLHVSGKPAVASVVPSGTAGFVVCPLVWQVPAPVVSVWQQLYQEAYARAQAVHRPSPLERLYQASRN